MHWLEDRIQQLYQSEQKYSAIRRSQTANKGIAERSKEREFRSSFLDDIKQLVQTVSDIHGISGCIACHDGLLVAQAGNLSDFEAVAAIAQECISTAAKSTSPLELGALRQVSIVGDQAKLALIAMGEITVGIVCPVETVLSQVLRDDPVG
ncbi:MAG: hypothetical protein ACRERU_21755 [Methylococcales bacterium]